MLSLIIIFSGIILFTLFCKDSSKKNIAMIVLGLTLWFVYFAIDYSKLPDISAYQDSFKFYNNISISQISQIDTYDEPGYIAFNIFVSRFSGNFRFFYLAYAIIVISSFATFLKRYSNNIWLSGMLLICMFYFPLFLLRQYMAMAICLCALPFVFKQKPIHFFAFVLFAFFFHRTSIVFAICYFLPKLKINYKTLILIIIFGVILAMSLGILITYIPDLVVGMDNASHYMDYFKEENTNNSWKAAAIPVAVVVFSLMCYRNHLKELNTRQTFFFYMCIIYTLLAVIDTMGTAFSAIYRITPFFSISVLILIPDALSYIRSQGLRVFFSTIILLAYFYTLMSTSAANGAISFDF